MLPGLPGVMIKRVYAPPEGTDCVMIEPSPAGSSLFLYGSMNFAERVHSLNYGYNSMDVSLERLAADRFLQQAVVPAGRRRFDLIRQQSTVPAR